MFLTREEIDSSKEAIVDDLGIRITYGTLREDCERFASHILARSMILLVADRKVDTIRFYYCAMAARCVPLLLDSNNNPEFINRYIELYRPQYIWIPASMKDEIDVEGELLFDNKQHAVIATKYPKYPIHDDLAILLTTSGSTGNPKTVRLSSKNIQENAYALIDALNFTQDERGVVTLPINYTYGMAICHMHFFTGSTLLVTERKIIDPEFEAFLEREYVTNLHGVPFVYEMLNKIGFLDRIPCSVRFVAMGGGRASEALHTKMNRVLDERNIRFYALYGQTEGTTILTKLPEGKSQNEPGCIGVACYGMQAYIDEANDELVFEGSSVCMGYASDWKDLMKGDENQGILYTGDIARIDEQGCIFLNGRLKRIVKLLGVRINMDDIEHLVEEYFEKECICGGSDDGIKIYVADEIDDMAVKRYLTQKFRVSARLIQVCIVDEIPRNSQGKVDYQRLEKMS